MAQQHFGEYVKALRKDRGWSQEKLAVAAGISRGTIELIERSAVPKSYSTTLRAVASVFDMTEDDLDRAWRGGDAADHTQHRSGSGVPIINQTAAGPPHDYTDVGHDQYDYIPIDAAAMGDPDAFAVRVVGDSMSPLLTEGDVVVFGPGRRATEGDVCFVQLTDEAAGGAANTIKRVEVSEGQIRLVPINPRHRALAVSRAAVARCVPALAIWSVFPDPDLAQPAVPDVESMVRRAARPHLPGSQSSRKAN